MLASRANWRITKKMRQGVSVFIFYFYSLFSLFFPLLTITTAPAYAQETTEVVTTEPTPTQEQESTSEPEQTPSPEPTVSVEPTPTVEPTAESTPELTPEPTIEPTPEPTVEEQPTEVLGETAVNEEETQLNVALVPSALTTEEEQVIDDSPISESESSATLATDKSDYTPNETATITGSGLEPNTTYTIVISSNDDPAVRHEGTFTTSAEGSFVYTYQLDGAYRPNYSVEIKDASGALIATTSFTDSHIASHVCTTDAQGADDEPGQKDLTQMCYDYSGLSTSITTEWNWDDTAWPGTNTGDACALFDNDGNGFADYATCVTVEDGPPAVQKTDPPGSPRVFTCNDSRADRCAGAVLVAGPYSTNCAVSQQATQPFAAGDSTPNDTVAACTIFMSEVGSGTAQLVDVCSFPSDNPNSDPSDCIRAAARTGKLEVVKDLIPSDDSGRFNLQIDGSTFSIDAGDGGTTGEQIVSLGDHTVGETAGTSTSLANYDTAISCRDLNGIGDPAIASSTDSGPLTVNIVDGADVICTITNTLSQGTLIVEKVVINDDGGLLGADDFSYQIDGGTAIPFEADGSNSQTLDAGIYDVTEPAVAGYSTTYENCTDVVVPPNGEATCTITNNDIAPLLTVTKIVVGGAALVSDFDLFVGATQVTSGVQNEFAVGDYVVSETPETGYTGAISGDCDENGNVSLALADVKECTITNTRDTGTITVIKEVEPDDSSSWDIEIGGPTLNSDTLGDGESTGALVSYTGTYTITETGDTGTDAGDYNSLYVCSNGLDPVTSGVGTSLGFTLNKGENIVCTFTNEIKRGSIFGYKYEDLSGDLSDDGDQTPVQGLLVQLWQWVVDQFIDTGLSDTTDANGYYEFLNLLPALYQVREVLNSLGGGWTNVSSTTSTDITLEPDDREQRDFVNTQYASITIYKDLDTDGDGQVDVLGTTAWTWDLTNGDQDIPTGSSADELLPGDYTFGEDQQPGYHVTDLTCGQVNYGAVESQQVTLSSGEDLECTFTNTRDTGTIKIVKQTNPDGSPVDFTFSGDLAGQISDGEDLNLVVPTGSYSSIETVPSGWTLDSIVCDDSNSTGDTETGTASFNVETDEVVTCTFTNTQQSRIVIAKETDPDGSGQSFHFNASYDVDGFDLTDGNSNTSVYLAPGLYSVSEVVPSGWDNISAVCSDQSNPNEISLQAGEAVTCTFTNGQLPQLTVTKIVTNDNGGTKDVADFPLFVDGNGVTSGATNTYQPDDYVVSETGNPGYSAAIGDECDENGNVSLAYGNNKTCTITNDDVPPQLHLRKEVLTDNGGIASETDWTLSATGTVVEPTNLEGTTPVDSGLDFKVDTYTLAEIGGPSGYSASSWVCDGGSQDGDEITVDLGDDVTCTVTNDDQTGRLVVVKVLINDNGGDLHNEDFSYMVNDGLSIFFEADGQNEETVDAGNYTIVEDAVEGYETIYDNCDEVFVPNGGSATCTITNDDIAPTLKLVKEVTNDDGGNAVAGDWDLTAAGNGGFTDQGDSTTFHTVLANEPYTLSESTVAGYTPSSWDCDNDGLREDVVLLGPGENVTCTITNDDIAPTVTLIKEVVGGSAEVSDFSLYLGGSQVTSGDANSVFANTPYSIDEDWASGYSFTSLTGDAKCPAVLGGTVTLDEDEDITCTITNTRDTGTIIVHKIIDADGDLNTTDDQFPGEDWEMDVDGDSEDTSDLELQNTDSNGETTFSDLKTGDYDVFETLQDGYDMLDAYCDGENGSWDGGIYGVEVDAEETVNCTFINSPNGTIHGQKWHDIDGNGFWDFEEPALGGWRIFLDENDNQTWDNGEEYMFTDDDQELGWYWFEQLFPGTYTVCEETQPGWIQTSSPICHTVDVNNGGENSCIGERQINSVDGETCNFGNQEQDPVLTLTKSNDTGGADETPGGSVLFTLTVTATESAALNVEVTDLPAGGFTYQPGSFTATSNINGALSIPEPVYASPGVWQLGDMAEDEVITLTYLATISNEQQAGLYQDLAWAQGETLASEQVLANLDTDPTYFVGTEVNVVRDDQDVASASIQGQVLGATTELPATGARTFWLILSFLLIVAGGYGLKLGLALRKKYA